MQPTKADRRVHVDRHDWIVGHRNATFNPMELLTVRLCLNTPETDPQDAVTLVQKVFASLDSDTPVSTDSDRDAHHRGILSLTVREFADPQHPAHHLLTPEQLSRAILLAVTS